MLNVLIVDDEEAIRDVIGLVLESDGHSVEQTATAEEAIRLFRKNSYHLVITDIRMDGVSGLELLKIVKTINPDTYVVIITGYSRKEYAVTALKTGAFDYLEKPFTDLDVISKTAERIEEKIGQEKKKNTLVKTLQKEYKKLYKENQELETMATRDGLTGLFNRRFFEHTLQKEISRARRYSRALSIIFVDIDYFKSINDNHGHQRGDEILREVASILSENIRGSDIPARYGGEEFVILLPEADEEGAFTVAEKFRSLVEKTRFAGMERQPKNKLTISAGVATFNTNMDCYSFVEAVDKALYTSKQSGRNKVTKASELKENRCFTPKVVPT